MTSLTLEAFRVSLGRHAPPPDLPAALAALWWAGKDDWSRTHAIVQDADGGAAAWVHAHLHRVEGDGNAGYCYRRAGKPVATSDTEKEREAIASALLETRTTEP